MNILNKPFLDFIVTTVAGGKMLHSGMSLGLGYGSETILGIAGCTALNAYCAVQGVETAFAAIRRMREPGQEPLPLDGWRSDLLSLGKWTFGILYSFGISTLAVKGLGLASSLRGAAHLVFVVSLSFFLTLVGVAFVATGTWEYLSGRERSWQETVDRILLIR